MSHVALRGGSRAPRRRLLAPLATVVVLALAPSVARAAELNATTSSFASVYASAAGGDTIHLAAGDYGQWSPASSKSSVVTIVPQSGATVKMNPYFSPASNLKLDGLTITGAYLNGARNVSIVNSAVTAMMRIDTPTSTPNANILIDHDTFSAINVCSTCYEGRLTVRGYDNDVPVGVTISNNLFGPNGDADGVQIVGNAYGVQVGPGNEFHDLLQVSQAHTDPIQLYGSSHTLITGNWMHDNATGIMAPDGSDHETITNNVIETTGYPWPMVMGAAVGNTITHNTLPGSGGTIEVDRSNSGATSSGNLVKDNVLTTVANASGGSPQGTSVDYNLIADGTMGSHDIKADPIFAGGTSPATYAGYALAPGSTGSSAASNGTAMGITGSGGATPPPADTTAPDTSISSGPTGATNDNTPTFTFSATESGSTLQCKTDSGSWASCTSPKTLATLADGSHTFSVRATDAAGNTDASPATAAFTVTTTAADTTPPDTSITSGPTGATNDNTPTFAFTSTESGSTFQCRADLGTWTTCTGPKTLATQADGNHTFAVRAKDGAGNTDGSAASRAFTVDTKAPQTTIPPGSPAASLSGNATISFTSDDTAARHECQLDDGAWTACTSPSTVSGLSIGQHTLLVRSTDAAGNVESPGASTTWLVLLPDIAPTVPTVPEAPAATTADTPAIAEPDPAPAAAPNQAPTVALIKPTAGARFTKTLTLAATAADDAGIDHVEFWIDGRRVASDAAAPYAVANWSAPRRLRYGTHTVVARAFDGDGAAASAAVNVIHVKQGSTASAAASGSWRMTSASDAATGTALRGNGPPRDAAKVAVTRCADAKGKAVRTVKVRAGRDGTLASSLADKGLCVLSVRDAA